MALPTTKTDLINIALDLAGEPPITDPTSAQKIPSLCDRHYDLVRTGVLTQNKWVIALALDDLAEVVTPAPPTPWTHSFQLPTDWLATFDSSLGGYRHPRVAPYVHIGERIYTTASAVRLLYARDTNNVSEMPPYLILAIAAELARHIVVAIKGDYRDDRRLRVLDTIAEGALDKARLANAVIDPEEVWGVDYLTSARLGGNSPYYDG